MTIISPSTAQWPQSSDAALAPTGIYPLFIPSAGDYATYNPSDKAAGITLSGGNLTQTGSGGPVNLSVRATVGKSSGKWYWEVVVGTSGDLLIGIANLSHSVNSAPGFSVNSWSYYVNGTKYTNSSSSAYGSSFTAGDRIGVALDMDNGKVWFSKNGVWQNSGDPAAGTNAAFTGLTGTIYPCDGQAGANAATTANYGASALTYTPPAGFNSGLYNLSAVSFTTNPSLANAVFTNDVTGGSLYISTTMSAPAAAMKLLGNRILFTSIP